MNVKRGELYYADLSPVVGSEQGGIRPVLVVQNDVGNKYSPTVIAAAVTSKINKAKLPTHIELPSAYGLAKDSVILLEQIRTIDKRRLKERIGELPPSTMNRVNKAILILSDVFHHLHPIRPQRPRSSPIPCDAAKRHEAFFAPRRFCRLGRGFARESQNDAKSAKFRGRVFVIVISERPISHRRLL